jgi:cytochrome c biogenesis protein ResB
MVDQQTAKRPLPFAATVADLAELFSDFWFGMMLLAVWGVMTLIGVIVDQGKDADFYLTNYTPALARLVLRLHLDNIYHSPAYIGIVAMILATMTFATFRVVIPRRLPPLRPVKIDFIPLHATVAVEGDERTLREKVDAYFADHGWQIRKREHDGVEWTFADKHNWARRGVLIAHVGFVLIAIGTTLYWAFGFDGTTAVLAGETVSIPRSGAQLRLERFGYRIDPIKTRSGIVYQPIDYVSHLQVAGKDGRFRPETLRVNHPIDIDGTLYYQASYGYAIELEGTKNGTAFPITASGAQGARSSAEPYLKEGQGANLDATHGVRYAKFVGTIDRRRGSAGADPRPNDPGVVLQFFEGDRLVGETIVPIGDSIDLGGGLRISPKRYILYSGIQYRHDPGIPLVGLGAGVLLAGLIISFYFVPARLYVRLDGAGRAWNLGVAATTVKGYDVFEDQFNALVASLRTSLPATAS